MKKTILVLLSVVMAVAMVLTLTACDSCARTGHKWDEGTVSTPADCGNDGEMTYVCTVCGTPKTETINATNDHDWGTWGPSEVEGKQERECSVCHKKDYKDVTPPVGECTHDSLTKVDALAPDCTNNGNIQYWRCNNVECGKLFRDEDATEQITLDDTVLNADPTAHKYGTIHQAVAGVDCLHEGTIAYYQCSACDKYFNSDKQQVESISDGVKGNHKTESLTKHDAVPATCSQPGNFAYWDCKDCHKIYSDVFGSIGSELASIPVEQINPDAHDYTNQPLVSDGNGNHYHECVRYEQCQTHDTAVACELEWKFEGEQHWQYCNDCQYTTNSGNHNYTGDWTKVDDNTHHRKCESCDAYETANHTWAVESWTWNVADGQGTATAHLKCSVETCTATHDVENLPAAYSKQDATCTADGWEKYTAHVSYQGLEEEGTKTETLEKIAHQYEKYVKIDEHTHKVVCKVCDTVDPSHTSDDHVYNQAGDTCLCGALDPNHCDHDNREHIDHVPATCETDEVVERWLCQCGKSFKMETGLEELTAEELVGKKASGHSWNLAESAWTWSHEGGAKAILHLVCENDDEHTHDITFTQQIQSSQTDATCLVGTVTTYTISVSKEDVKALFKTSMDVWADEADEQALTSSNSVTAQDALGHSWTIDTDKGTDGWTWTHGDAVSVVLHLACENCEVTTSVDLSASIATSTTPSTSCQVKATTTYSISIAKGDVVSKSGFSVSETGKDHWANDVEATLTHTDLTVVEGEALAHDYDGQDWVADEDNKQHYKLCKYGCETRSEAVACTGFDTWVQGDDNHYHECPDCHGKYDSTSHTPETVHGTPATCTQPGTSDWEKCSTCDKTLKEQTTVEATGHSYEKATWEKVDEQYHHRKCDNCDEYEENKAHNWGTTATEYNSEGHTLKCEQCEATKTVAHDWEYTDKALETHTKSCSVNGCEESVTENHDFGYGEYGSDTRKDCECGEPLCGTVDGIVEIDPKEYGTSSGGTPITDKTNTTNTLHFGENDEISIYFEQGTAGTETRWWQKKDLRFYAGSKFTVKGTGITKIVLAGAGSNISLVDSNQGTYSNNTWSGTATDSVAFKVDKNATITSITIIFTVEKGTHNLVEVIDEATCTEAGLLTKTCKRCGLVETEILEATGHVFTEELHHELEEASCTKEGMVEYYECATCGKKFASNEDKFATDALTDEQLKIEKEAHVNSGEWHKGEGEHVGYHYQECSVCNSEEGRNYTACNTNTWYQDDDTNHWSICDVCGYFNETDKQNVEEHTYDPSTKLCKCGKVDTSHTHEWGEEVPEVLSTCDTEGHPAYVQCTDCGNYYADKSGNVLLSERDNGAPKYPKREHNLEGAQFEDIGDGQHAKKCQYEDCGAVIEETKDTHTMGNPQHIGPVDKATAAHTVTCGDCGFNTTEQHVFDQDGNSKCKCGEVLYSTTTITLNKTYLGFPSSNSYPSSEQTITKDGVTYGYVYIGYGGNFQLQATNGKLYNKTAFAGDIVSIVITSASNNTVAATYSLEMSNNADFSGAKKFTDFTFDPAGSSKSFSPEGGSYQYFRLIKGSKNAGYLDSIVITLKQCNHLWEVTESSEGNCATGEQVTVKYHCDRCGADRTETESAKHNIELVSAQIADCTQQGWEQHYECTVCNKWFNGDGADATEVTPEIQDVTAHKADSDVWHKEDGQHWQVCEVCKQDFNKGAHQYMYEYENDSTHLVMCADCDLEESQSHVLTWILSADGATHTEKCTAEDCTYEKADQQHVYDQEDSKCKCGAKEGHTHNYDGQKWAEVTEGEYVGYHYMDCTTCSDRTYQPCDTEKWDNNDTDHWKICSECGHKDSSTTANHDNFEYKSNTDSKHNAHCLTCDGNIEQNHEFVYSDLDDPDDHLVTCEYCDWDGITEEHHFTGNVCDDCEYEKKVVKKFVKVTSALSDWSGEYLIVYETGNVAFNGALTTLDATKNTVAVTIDNNNIAWTEDLAKATFTFAKSGTNYTIKSASGYYIGQNSDANGLTTNKTTQYNNTITFANANDITIKSSGGAYLRFNAAADQLRFRYIKSGTYTQQKAIQLYMYVEE